MSTSLGSRGSAIPPPAPSLAFVLDLIVADASLSDRRRQDLASALRTVAKVIGKPMEMIPAHPGYLRDRFKDISPAMTGLSIGSWRNAVSGTRSALKHVGLLRMPGRYRDPLAPAWAQLFNGISGRYVRYALSRFLRYCSTNGIAPEAVDDAVMTAFHAEMTTDGLGKLNPRKVHRDACLAWNKVKEATPAWPQRTLTVPDYRATHSLGWEEFPATLKEDVDAYLNRPPVTNLLEGGDLRPLRQASIISRLIQLRAFASALVHLGRDADSIRTLADLVKLDAVKLGLSFYIDRAGNKTTTHIFGLAHMLTTIARHHVYADGDQTNAAIQAGDVAKLVRRDNQREKARQSR